MKQQNKLKKYVLTGALSLGVVCGLGFTTYAAMNNNGPANLFQHQGGKVAQNLDDATKEQIQQIMEEAKEQLAELGVTLPEKNPMDKMNANLDEETKEEVQAIMEQVKQGELTKEEAQAQLEELGIERPAFEQGNKRPDPFANLDEETKEEVQAIMEQVKQGELTKEEAQAELEELGVEFPAFEQGNKRPDPFANLDEETKEEVQAIMEQVKQGELTKEEAQAELEELGIERPAFEQGNKRPDPFANLDEETKEQAQEILDEAKEQIDALLQK